MMYEDLNKIDGKRVAMFISFVILSVSVFIIIYSNLFSFADFLEDGGVKPARLYGGGFCALIGIGSLIGLPRALTKTSMESLKKYARTTENPEATLENLKETWQNGVRLRDWCRMDEMYIIAFINGTTANIIPMKDVVWAYKTVTRYNFVIKTGTTLNVRYANQKFGIIPIREAAVDFILQQFMEKHRDIVIGHTREVEKFYLQKDMVWLKEYAIQQRLNVN